MDQEAAKAHVPEGEHRAALQYACPLGHGESRLKRFEHNAATLLEEFRRRRPMRAGSLIVSFFGDVIGPRGGSVWLGSMIGALEPLGVSARLVRTSMYRLVQDGWFQARRQGRRSYYSLTESGQRRFRRATARIYGPPPVPWRGDWLIALLPQASAETREALRRELSWLGFGSLASGALGRPVPPGGQIQALVGELVPVPVTFAARLLEGAPEEAVRQLVRGCWKLEQIEARYREFLRRFGGLLDVLPPAGVPPGPESLALRVMLIHEYRRILLGDPQLPAALLPRDWHGQAAYQMCKALYDALLTPSEAYADTVLRAEHGPLPAPEPALYRRFVAPPLA